MSPCVATGRPYPPGGPSMTGGTQVYPPLHGSGWALRIPWSPMGRPYLLNGPGRIGGTRVYPPLCGNGWTSCLLFLPRGVPIPKTIRARTQGLGCIGRCVEWRGLVHTLFSHGASLCPKRPRRDRRNSGVSAAVWEDGDGNAQVFPRGAPIPQAAQARPGGLGCIRRCVRVAGPYACLALPRGVLIPQTAQAGPDGLGCACGCEGITGPCVSSFYHGVSLSLKRPRQGRRDSGVSAVVWVWLGPVHT